MNTIALARFLNQISETETHFDDMSKKVQSIYERRAMQIMLFLMDNGFGSECTDQERLDYFSAGFCSGYKAGGVEEDWIDEAFCEYEKKRRQSAEGENGISGANHSHHQKKNLWEDLESMFQFP